MVAGLGRKGHAVGDIPGIRFLIFLIKYFFFIFFKLFIDLKLFLLREFLLKHSPI